MLFQTQDPFSLPPPLLPECNSTLTGLKHQVHLVTQWKEYITTAFVCNAKKQCGGNRCLLISHSHGKDKYTARGVSDWRKAAGSGDIRSHYGKLYPRRAFRFYTEPIKLDEAGLIGRLRMPANGGDVLGILLSIKKLQQQSW